MTTESYPPEAVPALIRKLEAEAGLAQAQAASERRRTDIDAHDAWMSSYMVDLQEYGDESYRVYRLGGEIDGKTAGSCLRTLSVWERKDPESPVEVVISSQGGDILSGLALFDFLKTVRPVLTTGVLGVAASMAGVLLQAGDHRWMGRQAHLMIHRAAFGAVGKAFEVEDQTEFVRKLEEQIAGIYAERSLLSVDDVVEIFKERKDRWIGAAEALGLGLVDEVR